METDTGRAKNQHIYNTLVHNIEINRQLPCVSDWENEDLAASTTYGEKKNLVNFGFSDGLPDPGDAENDVLKERRESILDPKQKDRIAGEIVARANRMKMLKNRPQKDVDRYLKAATKLLQCRRDTIVLKCRGCGCMHAMPNGCRLGICPDCAKDMSMDRARIYDLALACLLGKQELRGKDLRFVFLTLTVKHRATLKATLNHCERSARRLYDVVFKGRGRRWLKKRLLEMPLNDETRRRLDLAEVEAIIDYTRYTSEKNRSGVLWKAEVSKLEHIHGHVHALALCRFIPNTTKRRDGKLVVIRIPRTKKKPSYEFTPTCNWLSVIWAAITGDSYIVSVSKAGNFESFNVDAIQKTLLEVVKYPFKFPGADKIENLAPEDRKNLGEQYFPVQGMADLYETFAGRRSVWTTGLLRGLMPEPGSAEWDMLLASWCKNCSSDKFELDYIASPAWWMHKGNDRYTKDAHDRQGRTLVEPRKDLSYIEMLRELRRNQDLEKLTRRYWMRRQRFDPDVTLDQARGDVQLTIQRLAASSLRPPDRKWQNGGKKLN